MASWKKVIVSGSNAVLAQVTASGGFSGDGSGLTGITATSVDIDGLSALGGTGVAQGDHFIFSDGGTEKKITFSNLSLVVSYSTLNCAPTIFGVLILIENST